MSESVVTDVAAEVVDDTGFYLRKWTMHILGKGGIKHGAAPMLAQSVASALGMTGTTAVSGITLGLGTGMAAAFSSALVQGEYLHKRDAMRRQYCKEVGAVLGKEPGKVTFADVHLVAFGDKARGMDGNPALAEAITESKKKRNWGVAVSVLASTAAAVGLFALSGSGGLLEGLMHPHIAGLSEGMNTALGVLSTGALTFSMYTPVSLGLHWAEENVFGVEKETVHDKIREIHKMRSHGKTVSQEKVFEAYIEAHPDLNEDIAASYGSHFKYLSRQEKVHLLTAIGPELQLEKITSDINRGQMRPEELAFAVFGQSSGITHEEMMQPLEPKKGLLVRAWHKTKDMLGAAFGRKAHEETLVVAESHPVSASAGQTPQMTHYEMSTPDGNGQLAVDHYHHEADGQQTSFVKMVGQQRGKDGSVSFVEQLEQSRHSQTMTPSVPG